MFNLKIGIITYKANHLKTEQILNVLVKYYSTTDITIYALPFIKRKERDVIFDHRPSQNQGIDTENIAKAYNLNYINCKNGDIDINNSSDLYLITGAGIISKECIQGKKIINCHPGIIPLSRGLDSFKWAIYDSNPVGVSLHYIDSSVDFGEIISIEKTMLFKDDTLYSFARRHYELEVEMLSHFQFYIENKHNNFKNCAIGISRMRMKKEIEIELEHKFILYKKKYASDI